MNKALLDHFLVACCIRTHFTAIKRFLLLEDGEFAHVLCSGLCEELAYGAVPLYLSSSSFLNPLLRLSLESSLHGHTPQAQRLAFKLKYRPTIIHTQGKEYYLLKNTFLVNLLLYSWISSQVSPTGTAIIGQKILSHRFFDLALAKFLSSDNFWLYCII